MKILIAEDDPITKGYLNKLEFNNDYPIVEYSGVDFPEDNNTNRKSL